MHLPSRHDDVDKIHYLTDFYNKKFELTLAPFLNYDDHTFLKFYNYPAVTITSKFSEIIISKFYISI